MRRLPQIPAHTATGPLDTNLAIGKFVLFLSSSHSQGSQGKSKDVTPLTVTMNQDPAFWEAGRGYQRPEILREHVSRMIHLTDHTI